MAETNALLKSIGAGINLNVSDVVEKQIKDMLTRYRAEVRKASEEAGKSSQDMANSMRSAESQIKSLLTTTQKLNADGSISETRKGYDELGRSITEVYKAGQLLNRSISTESTLASDIKKANELYQQQLSSIKKIYDLRSKRLTVEDNSAMAAELDKQIATNRQLISQLDQEAVSRSRLVNLTQEEAAAQQKYNNSLAAQKDRAAAKNNAEGSGTKELKQMQAAYQQLTNAYRQYNLAVKSGNEAGKAYWSQSAQQALQEINGIEEKIGSLTIEEDVRKKILDLIAQARNAEATQRSSMGGIKDDATALGNTLDRISSRLIQMATTMLLLRG